MWLSGVDASGRLRHPCVRNCLRGSGFAGAADGSHAISVSKDGGSLRTVNLVSGVDLIQSQDIQVSQGPFPTTKRPLLHRPTHNCTCQVCCERRVNADRRCRPRSGQERERCALAGTAGATAGPCAATAAGQPTGKREGSQQRREAAGVGIASGGHVMTRNTGLLGGALCTTRVAVSLLRWPALLSPLNVEVVSAKGATPAIG